MAVSTDNFGGVDLSRLPAPNAIEPLDYATIRDALLADIVAWMPEFSALSSADPAVKLAEYFAAREYLVRQRINEASLANMLAFAGGGDLDHIGATRFGLERFIIVAANPVTGTEDQLESDADFRARLVASPESWSVAGPLSAYTALAKSADPQVRHASAISPAPCEILVAVQSREGTGEASPALLAAVATYLNHEDRRPGGDRLTVQSADIKPFQVTAVLRGNNNLILSLAETKLRAWLDDNLRLGRDITIDAIHAALTAEGVSRVALTDWVDIICGVTEAAYCTAITLTYGGAAE